MLIATLRRVTTSPMTGFGGVIVPDVDFDQIDGRIPRRTLQRFRCHEHFTGRHRKLGRHYDGNTVMLSAMRPLPRVY